MVRNHSPQRQNTCRPPSERRWCSGVAKALRWLSAPVACVGAAWCLALRPAAFLNAVPSLMSRYNLGGIHAALPLHPGNLKEAFDLGVAFEKLAAGGAAALAEALQIAERIAKRRVTEDELRALPQLLEAMLQEKDLVSRVLSFFSLVNVVWFVAIIGLTVTLAPFIYVITAPFRKLLTKISVIIVHALKRCAQELYPVYEVLGYAATLLIAIESTRYAPLAAGSPDAYGMTGTMLGVTSVAGFVLCWVHTVAKNSTGGGNFETFMMMTNALVALYALPLTKIHQSTLLGYLTSIAIAGSLGFSAYSSGLCTVIGFQSREGLLRGAIGCGTLTVANVVAKLAGVESLWLTPMQPAIGVIGTTVYLLALDIHAFVSRRTASHVFFVANLVGLVVAGELIGLKGTANVAKVFSGLFGFTLYCEAMPRGSKDGFIVWLFALFAVLYGASMYLNQHPELITALLRGGQ